MPPLARQRLRRGSRGFRVARTDEPSATSRRRDPGRVRVSGPASRIPTVVAKRGFRVEDEPFASSAPLVPATLKSGRSLGAAGIASCMVSSPGRILPAAAARAFASCDGLNSAALESGSRGKVPSGGPCRPRGSPLDRSAARPGWAVLAHAGYAKRLSAAARLTARRLWVASGARAGPGRVSMDMLSGRFDGESTTAPLHVGSPFSCGANRTLGNRRGGGAATSERSLLKRAECAGP